MTNEEKVQTLQRQLDMTNANYNILNKKYIEANIKIKHLIDGIEMIKHREYSDISQIVIENSVLKKKNREQDEEIKVLEEDKKHFKQIAENVVNLLSKLNKELPNPQGKELNYEKCISDTILIIKEFKQSQNSKAIEVLEDIIKTCNLAKEFCGAKATALDITSANVYNQCIDDIKIIINNQITELRG